jgi:O-antigen ligase
MSSIHIIRSQQMKSVLKSIRVRSISKFSIVWFFWFFICFYPVTISEFGVNYLFALTPIFYVIFGGRLRLPPPLLRNFGFLLLLILITSSIYQFYYIDFAVRRFVSFLLFVSIFSLAFLRFEYREFNSALIALIFVSSLISLNSIYSLILLGLVNAAHEAKNEVGSQRVGFFLIFSFWAVCWLGTDRDWWVRFILFGLCGLLLAGIMLTFSRTSVVALIGSGIFYIIIKSASDGIFRFMNLIGILVNSLAVLLLVLFIYYSFPSIYQFFNERLFEFFVSGRVFDHVANPDTSEGVRIRIWGDIINFVMLNPITGSGYLGSWILGDDSGSSHNQYMDVFFRLGIIGFSVYIVVLFVISKFLIRLGPLLISGFVGVLIYGFTHETFKEPGGALLLAVLLAYYSSYRIVFNVADSCKKPKHGLTKH